MYILSMLHVLRIYVEVKSPKSVVGVVLHVIKDVELSEETRIGISYRVSTSVIKLKVIAFNKNRLHVY